MMIKGLPGITGSPRRLTASGKWLISATISLLTSLVVEPGTSSCQALPYRLGVTGHAGAHLNRNPIGQRKHPGCIKKT